MPVPPRSNGGPLPPWSRVFGHAKGVLFGAAVGVVAGPVAGAAVYGGYAAATEKALKDEKKK